MNCKVRFAPSPTGFMHIGNIRIAIINYLFSKKNNGSFLFRLDDTDILRSTKEYEDGILDDLNWLGIKYNETFRQSERLDLYKENLKKLIDDGLVYKCYETPEELEYKKKISRSKGLPPIYDRESLNLSELEKKNLESKGLKPYWRFKLPNKVISWNDMILGKISYDLSKISDPVLVKTDGTFLYTFSSVVDDIYSNITHIIRGQDHITNTAVQIALFDSISKSRYNPNFAHLSLLVNKDGSQFSKRLGSTSLLDIRKNGIDKMAIYNIIATLGSSLDTIPFNNIEDLIDYFDITKFSTNSPKFDTNDIFKINKKIMHSKTYEELKSHLKDSIDIPINIFNAIKENVENYNDFERWSNILRPGFISTKFKPSTKDKEILELTIKYLEELELINEDSIKKILNNIKDKTQLSGKSLYMPIRKSITDMDYGPHIYILFEIIGKKELLNRFKHTVNI